MLTVAKGRGFPLLFSVTLPTIIPLFFAAKALLNNKIVKINVKERNLLYIVLLKFEYIVLHNIIYTPLDED